MAPGPKPNADLTIAGLADITIVTSRMAYPHVVGPRVGPRDFPPGQSERWLEPDHFRLLAECLVHHFRVLFEMGGALGQALLGAGGRRGTEPVAEAESSVPSAEAVETLFLLL